MKYVIQLIMAFIGSLGFAGIFNIKKELLFPASLGGILSWAIYLITNIFSANEILCYFVASLSFTFYAEIMAIQKKTPVTLFIVPAAIPLIPGRALYSTMRYAVQGKSELSFQSGIYTFLLAGAISCGILCTMTIWPLFKKFIDSLCKSNN